MQPNYLGRSPFFIACMKQNLEIMKVFKEWKYRAMTVQDYLGENMLFVCARNGDLDIYNWLAD